MKELEGIKIELNGSEKQIAWAENIITCIVGTLTGNINKQNELEKKGHNFPEFQEALNYHMEQMKKLISIRTDASWWIENRHKVNVDVLMDSVHKMEAKIKNEKKNEKVEEKEEVKKEVEVVEGMEEEKKMKKFIDLEKQEYLLNEEVEQYGILENEDGLYELCNKENDESFTTVNVIYEDGIYYVDFNEESKWAENNIIIGYLEC